MIKEYKNCTIEVEEIDEGVFEMSIEDNISHIYILQTQISSDEEYEESLIEKLEKMVDEYRSSPNEYLEYGIPSKS